MKIVCLSFDDGTIYDKRFIELLNKHGLHATLNLNSGLKDFVWYYDDRPIHRLDLEKYKDLYLGHEVASHSFSHPYFSSLSEKQCIDEVKKDVDNLSKIFQREISGFAFPFSDQTEENISIVRDNFNFKYIRCSYFINDYFPKDRYHIHINAMYDDFDIYKKLKEYEENDLDNSIFVIAGHSYEFEVKNDWNKIEDLLIYLKNNKNLAVLTMEQAVKILFK